MSGEVGRLKGDLKIPTSPFSAPSSPSGKASAGKGPLNIADLKKGSISSSSSNNAKATKKAKTFDGTQFNLVLSEVSAAKNQLRHVEDHEKRFLQEEQQQQQARQICMCEDYNMYICVYTFLYFLYIIYLYLYLYLYLCISISIPITRPSPFVVVCTRNNHPSIHLNQTKLN